MPVADAGGEGRAERGAAGPFVAPGRYDVRLSVAGHDLRAELEVRADPRTGASAADLDAQLALLLRLRDLVSVANTAMNDLRAARTRLEGIACQGPVRGSLSRALDQVTRLELEIAGPPGGRTAGRFSPPALGAKLAGLSARVASADAAPTRASEQLAVALGRQVGAIVARVDVLVRHDLPLVERSGPRAPRQRTKPARRV